MGTQVTVDEREIEEARALEEAAAIGGRLREAREQRKLTLRAAALRLGVEHPTLHAYESGRRPPPLRTLSRAAEIYGLRRSWFFGESSEAIDTGEVDPIAGAALRELPPELQRGLVLEIWPAVRHLYHRVQPFGSVLGES